MTPARKTHLAWNAMLARCLNSNHPDFNRYGGRGITVCARWLDRSAFVQDMGLAPDGYSLDRIDNDGPYSPENCRWTTWSIQQANRGKRPGGTSRYKGVSRTRTGKWSARIHVNNRQHNLGTYLAEDQAAMAYNTAAAKHGYPLNAIEIKGG